MSIDRQMDKEVVVHIHSGILPSHKKERSCTVGENVIDTTTVEDSMEIPLKTRNKTTI